MSREPIAPLCALFLAMAAGRMAAQPPDGPIDSRLQPWFHLTVEEAAARLGDPACARVLTDFHDVAGRPLALKLEATGLDASAYVRSVAFRAGRGVGRCQARRILMLTTVLGRVVWVCESQYYRKEREEPEVAVALVIHEVLHTLGLGEDPPTSEEITARVLARCPAAAPASRVALIAR
jgi:hypothetical protein